MSEHEKLISAYTSANENIVNYFNSLAYVLNEILRGLDNYLKNSGSINLEDLTGETIFSRVTIDKEGVHYPNKFKLNLNENLYNNYFKLKSEVKFTLVINKIHEDYFFKILNFDQQFLIRKGGNDQREEFYKNFCGKIIEFYESMPEYIKTNKNLPSELTSNKEGISSYIIPMPPE